MNTEQATPMTYQPGALVRVSAICNNPRTGRAGLLPISRATWYQWIKAKRVPEGQRLGPNTVVWPIEVVLSLGKQQGSTEAQSTHN